MSDRSTEGRHPLSDGLHAIGAAEAALRLLNGQAEAVEAVRAAIPAIVRAAQASIPALRRGGKMAYAGAGSSGLMALADCLELPGTFGISPDRVPMLFAGGVEALLHMTGAVEDDPALALRDFQRADLSKGDVVLCLAASGGTPYTLTIADQARAGGVTVVGFSNVAGSPLLERADIPVFLNTGPELVSGSTRMAAATAQKMALNMLSVLVGIGLGHVHDGYMVNVTADNAKLLDRAARIVSDLSGASPAEAKLALTQTNGSVKQAVLVARGADPENAASDLHESGGHLAPLLRENRY